MGATSRQLGRNEIKSETIGTGDQVDESFEVGCRDGPADRREIILVMVDRYISVQRLISGVSGLAINEKHFLMDLLRGSVGCRARNVACTYP